MLTVERLRRGLGVRHHRGVRHRGLGVEFRLRHRRRRRVGHAGTDRQARQRGVGHTQRRVGHRHVGQCLVAGVGDDDVVVDHLAGIGRRGIAADPADRGHRLHDRHAGRQRDRGADGRGLRRGLRVRHHRGVRHRGLGVEFRLRHRCRRRVGHAGTDRQARQRGVGNAQRRVGHRHVGQCLVAGVGDDDLVVDHLAGVGRGRIAADAADRRHRLHDRHAGRQRDRGADGRGLRRGLGVRHHRGVRHRGLGVEFRLRHRCRRRVGHAGTDRQARQRGVGNAQRRVGHRHIGQCLVASVGDDDLVVDHLAGVGRGRIAADPADRGHRLHDRHAGRQRDGGADGGGLRRGLGVRHHRGVRHRGLGVEFRLRHRRRRRVGHAGTDRQARQRGVGHTQRRVGHRHVGQCLVAGVGDDDVVVDHLAGIGRRGIAADPADRGHRLHDRHAGRQRDRGADG